MNSLEKMLGLLDVFTSDRPIWSSEDLMQHLGSPASTCYRYLKVLHTAGYLARVANGSYVLGPRIMELDRVTRESDSVYLAGSPIAQRLTHQTGLSSLLCILFSDSIMCVQQAQGKEVLAGLFNRGQRRPLVAGASAKSILAYLPMHQLRILYARHAEAIAQVNLGTDWEMFKSTLKQIRQKGYSMTRGDYNPGIISIAAPIFNRHGEVLGSLSLTASDKTFSIDAFQAYAPQVIAAAQEIREHIAADDAYSALPARALG